MFTEIKIQRNLSGAVSAPEGQEFVQLWLTNHPELKAPFAVTQSTNLAKEFAVVEASDTALNDILIDELTAARQNSDSSFYAIVYPANISISSSQANLEQILKNVVNEGGVPFQTIVFPTIYADLAFANAVSGALDNLAGLKLFFEAIIKCDAL